MTLGKLLQSKRLELGRSLEQISAATRIHVRILQALEEDRYADLPARAFTRGFITSYCKALKLDPEQILLEHHDFLEQKFTERQDRDQGHQGYVFEGKELEQNRRGLIIIASVAAVFAITVLLFFKPQHHKRKDKHKELVENAASPQPATEPGEEDEIIDLTEPTPLATEDESKNSSAPSSSPTASPANTPRSTQTPTTQSATPSATPTPSPTASPSPAAAPSASPSPTGTPADKLNKGDNLKPSEIKLKIAFEALDDVYVKYQSDQRPPTEFVLRKGRFLVIKATGSIRFETNKPEALRYRTKTREYFPLDQSNFNVGSDGKLIPNP